VWASKNSYISFWSNNRQLELQANTCYVGSMLPLSLEKRAKREHALGGQRMKRMVKAVIILMAILTATYVGVVAYTSTNLSHSADSNVYRDPIEYGIWRHYDAEKLQWEPQEWYTPEELGIVLVKDKFPENYYDIFIVDEEKALPWMNGTAPMPYAVKYQNEFYRISWLWVTPGLPESVKLKQWQIPIGGLLGVGWVCTGVLFLKWKKEK